MKKILLALAVLLSGMASAENIVLDLSNPNEPLEYDENGVWTNVFNNNAKVTSQMFTFAHRSPFPQYSCGFFASKVTTFWLRPIMTTNMGVWPKGE